MSKLLIDIKLKRIDLVEGILKAYEAALFRTSPEFFEDDCKIKYLPDESYSLVKEKGWALIPPYSTTQLYCGGLYADVYPFLQAIKNFSSGLEQKVIEKTNDHNFFKDTTTIKDVIYALKS